MGTSFRFSSVALAISPSGRRPGQRTATVATGDSASAVRLVDTHGFSADPRAGSPRAGDAGNLGYAARAVMDACRCRMGSSSEGPICCGLERLWGASSRPGLEMQTLRDEILQAHQTRSDLLKWKLVVAGGLGAVGLGFAGAEGPVTNADLVLCAIPPACLYVDLLCRHLTLRIIVIGTFLNKHGAAHEAALLAAYEHHAERARNLSRKGRILPSRTMSAFALEDWALSWSTIALSLAVLVYGAIAKNDEFLPPFVVSGVLGVAVTVFAMVVYTRRFAGTTNLVAEVSADTAGTGRPRHDAR